MFLIIDTTSSKIKLAFGDRDIERESQKQSADLPIMVTEFLADIKPDAIGIITGPGSFTGIRLGISFAKGLAMGYQIPIVGLSVFDLFNAPVLGIKSEKNDYYVMQNDEYKIVQTLPENAVLIEKYKLSDAQNIIARKLSEPPQPIIPLYIRPSYIDK